MFRRIDHVEIVTRDPERLVAFYTGTIGFQVKLRERVPLSAGGGALGLVYLDFQGTGIELLTFEGPPVTSVTQALTTGYRMLAFEVDDMKQTLAELATKGLQPVWGPITGERYIRAEIADPDGNHLELRQWFPIDNL